MELLNQIKNHNYSRNSLQSIHRRKSNFHQCTNSAAFIILLNQMKKTMKLFLVAVLLQHFYKLDWGEENSRGDRVQQTDEKPSRLDS